MANSVVYFVADTKARLKVGTSKHFTMRLRAIAKEHGPLDVLGSFPGGVQLERKIHAALAEYSLGNEWFADCPEVRAIIASHEPDSPDVDVQWSAQETAATEDMRADLKALEVMCRVQGMPAYKAHAYLKDKYGIPGWALWNLKNRPNAVPSAALDRVLKAARLRETEEYALRLADEADEFPELRDVAARLRSKVRGDAA